MSQQTMWPEGRESAACFTFDLDGEEVWIADMQAAGRPGVLNLMDDIRPYRHPGTSLMELPVQHQTEPDRDRSGRTS